MIGLDTNVLVRYIMQDDPLQSPKATKQLKIENADQVLRALSVLKRASSDFADCLIERSAHSAGCDKTVTFDIKASQHAGMTLIT